MTEEQIGILSIAFRELRKFSIPGIGTFSRETEPSRFDAQTGLMHPPKERIKFDAGSTLFVESLRNFVVLNLNISEADAIIFVEGLAVALQDQLATYGSLLIPTQGHILLNRTSGAIDFEMLTTAAESAPTFELPPIKLHQPNPININISNPNNNSSTMNTAASMGAAGAAPINHVKTKKPPYIAIALVLMLAIIGGGFFFKDKITQMLSGKKQPNELPPGYQEVLVEDSLNEANKDDAQSVVVDTSDSGGGEERTTAATPVHAQTTSPKRPPADAKVVAPVTKAEPKKVVEDKKPAPIAESKPTPSKDNKKPVVEIIRGGNSTTEKPASSNSGSGSSSAPSNSPAPATSSATIWKASPNTYYLIAEGAGSKDDAEKKRQAWNSKGFTTKILEGNTPGTYRIAIVEAPNHKTVSTRLDQLKTNGTVRNDAWILKPAH